MPTAAATDWQCHGISGFLLNIAGVLCALLVTLTVCGHIDRAHLVDLLGRVGVRDRSAFAISVGGVGGKDRCSVRSVKSSRGVTDREQIRELATTDRSLMGRRVGVARLAADGTVLCENLCNAVEHFL